MTVDIIPRKMSRAIDTEVAEMPELGVAEYPVAKTGLV